MRTIGLIGGMTWESSIEYYRIINTEVNRRLGGVHSAKVLLISVDFDEIANLQHRDEWKAMTDIMIGAAQTLENGGADFTVICTNTMHKMADDVEKNTNIPLLHIVDAVAGQVKTQGFSKVGLLGTKFTMEHDFYKTRLLERHGIEALIPPTEERQIVHDVLYNEFSLGGVSQQSIGKYREIINNLAAAGAEGIILGCTEIPLFIKPEHSPVPLFDSTTIHAKAAVDFALQ